MTLRSWQKIMCAFCIRNDHQKVGLSCGVAGSSDKCAVVDFPLSKLINCAHGIRTPRTSEAALALRPSLCAQRLRGGNCAHALKQLRTNCASHTKTLRKLRQSAAQLESDSDRPVNGQWIDSQMDHAAASRRDISLTLAT
jgi:hypothetical protein